MALISGSGRRRPLLRITSGLSWNTMTPRKSPSAPFPIRWTGCCALTAFTRSITGPGAAWTTLYERPRNEKKPHYVVLEQLLGVVDTSCAKLSLLMHIAMGITREDYESKSLRYKIYLRSVEALEKGEY